MKSKTNCEFCVYYVFDEECNGYVCDINLDEDEMARYLSSTFYNCPYFQLDDEYKIVRKQN